MRFFESTQDIVDFFEKRGTDKQLKEEEEEEREGEDGEDQKRRLVV